jgi:hypothetical protein
MIESGGLRGSIMRTIRISWLISAAVATHLCVRADAQTPSIADQRAQRDRTVACTKQFQGALGRMSPDQEQAWRNCLAGGVAPPIPDVPRTIVDPAQPGDWRTGILYEKQGRYAEAAALYQQILNNERAPNGDGMVTGERLAYLYAHGSGVPKDPAKAKTLLSVRPDSQRNSTDLLLLRANLLPDKPEDITPALIDRAHVIAAQQDRILAEQERQGAEEAARAAEEENRRKQAWRAAHPQEAHAQDVQACISRCESNYQSCNWRSVGDMSAMFTGITPNYNCGPNQHACLSGCN